MSGLSSASVPAYHGLPLESRPRFGYVPFWSRRVGFLIGFSRKADRSTALSLMARRRERMMSAHAGKSPFLMTLLQETVLTDLYRTIQTITETILSGVPLAETDAERLLDLDRPEEILFLLSCANRVRKAAFGNRVEFCAIVNAKSGKCSENCAFCAQSSHHRTQAATYPLMSVEAMVNAAQKAREQGARRFSIVTSGKGILRGREFDVILEAVQAIREDVGLLCCASLGLLDAGQIRALKQAGVSRYHHNLETARSHFGQICTTHHYDERLEILRLCRAEGLEVCSGGILGMGERREQRLELAYALLREDVESVPINILNPIPGTPLERTPAMKPLEVLQTIAVFRLLMPRTEIRTCGGREAALRGLQPLMFTAGCTGAMIGNYLTTQGRSPAEDLRDAADLGLGCLGVDDAFSDPDSPSPLPIAARD